MSRRLAWVDFAWNIEPEAARNPSMYVAFLKVTARLIFFRLHGSHGEILPSVMEPCAGTTSSFSPAVVHSGFLTPAQRKYRAL
jgi:hypothetical protein